TWAQAASMVVAGFAPNIWVALPAMVITGLAWLAVANTLAVSAQLSLPDWVRARAMSTYQMAVMGGGAIGAAVWGQVASLTDVRTSISLAAITGIALLWLTRDRTLEGSAEEDLTPSFRLKAPTGSWEFGARDGPVLTTIEYRIDPSRAEEFTEVMQETRRRRLARGALSCELFRDTADAGHFIEYMIDESWLEHLRHFDRLTATDEVLRDYRLSFQLSGGPPVVTRSIAQGTRRS
ncbi:MAG: MFS transporter, partial [Gammaproteobacteria bacterium]